MLRIGVDTGGTFTDFVVLENNEIRVFKISSTPDKPEKAILEGLSRIVGDWKDYTIHHGSTVATNTLLQRKGARTLLVTNEGFEDILEIGRQQRPGLFQLSSSRPKPLVPSTRRLGIKERTLWDGRSLISLEKRSLDWLQNKVKRLSPEAIAIVLLYSYLNPDAEKQIARALESTQIPLSLSHEILPEFREFERTSATVINAYLTPTLSKYLSALGSHPLVERGKLTVMQSNGGSISAQSASSQPLRTLLSGPAGGVVGAFDVARQAGNTRIITFDMGGTSTDVSLCDNRIATTNESTINHQPVPVQMIDIHTVGAGGGSIARIDSGGLLRVGPDSAGADPGPVCYGKGHQVTVTDAHLALGHMDADFFLNGEMNLYPDKVWPALDELATNLGKTTNKSWTPRDIARGILKIVNTQMESALQVISVQRGYDTREFTLVSFGGAGGLHACDLARSLLIPRILIPPDPGMLSSLGILRADMIKDTSLTVMLNSQDSHLTERLQQAFTLMDEKILEELVAEGFAQEDLLLERSVDARYIGQSYELNLPFDGNVLESFHQLHSQFYGYSNPALPTEIVNIRVRGSGKYPSQPLPRLSLESEKPPPDALIQEKHVSFNGEGTPTRFYSREKLRPGNCLEGPAIILEYSSTALVPPDFGAQIDEWMNIVIEPIQ